MSLMERRLQLLLDAARYQRVEREALGSGRSVAAVIREAIDWRFDDGTQVRRRAAADLLVLIADASDPEPDWTGAEAAMDAELESKA